MPDRLIGGQRACRRYLQLPFATERRTQAEYVMSNSRSSENFTGERLALPDGDCRLWALRYPHLGNDSGPIRPCEKLGAARLGGGPGSVNFGELHAGSDEPQPDKPNNVLPRAAGFLHDGLRHEATDYRECSRRSKLRVRAFAIKHVGLNQHGRSSQGACGFCCLSSPSTIDCLQLSVLPSVHLTLLAGDFVLSLRHCPECTASAAAGVGSNQ